MDDITHGYLCLSFAIAARAIEDYQKVKRRLRNNPESAALQYEKHELEEFFRSNMFSYIGDFNEDLRKMAAREMISE